MATSTDLKPDHHLQLNFKRAEDVKLIFRLAKDGILRHVSQLNNKIRSETGQWKSLHLTRSGGIFIAGRLGRWQEVGSRS